MTELESFLDYGTFWKTVGKKRSKSIAMDDINLITFDEIRYNPKTNEYVVNVKLKEKYRDNYKTRKKLVMMENTHLIHWAEWLDIAILTKKYPALTNYLFLVTHVNIVLDEPCYIDQSIEFKIKLLIERIKKTKNEFKILHKIYDWTLITVDYVIVKEQMEILEYYHNKHASVI